MRFAYVGSSNRNQFLGYILQQVRNYFYYGKQETTEIIQWKIRILNRETPVTRENLHYT